MIDKGHMMTNEVHLETRFQIDYYIQQIAKRNFPPVFVVERNTEACWLVWEMEDQKLPDYQQVELAREAGIPVIDRMAAIRHLKDHMDPSDAVVLEDLIVRIFAARLGRVAIEDLAPERLRVTDPLGDAPLSMKVVPVEELAPEEVSQWLFLEDLEVLTHDHPISFLIPPTEPVLAYLAEHGGQSGY